MSQVGVIFPLLVLFSIRLVYGFPGDNVMLMSPLPLEVRNVDPYPTHPSKSNSFQFQANMNKPQQILNTEVMHRRQPQVPETEKKSNQNMTFGEFMEVLNEVSQSQKREEELRLRAAASTGRDINQVYPTLPRPMGGYSRPNYVPPATYQETAAPAPHTQPSSTQSKISLLKPDFPTKVSSKFSGLMGLIFSLLSSSSLGSHIIGMKEVLIEGIIKPLFLARGSLKVMMSKLTIPVIAMLLINFEVWVIIWWLWEECPVYSPEPANFTPAYSKPAPAPYNNNNNYNSYR